MSLSAYERETVIIFNDGEDTATVTSSQSTVWTKMARRGVEPDQVEKMGGRVVTKFFTVPKSWIKIAPPKRVSESQREAARVTLKKARSVPGARQLPRI